MSYYINERLGAAAACRDAEPVLNRSMSVAAGFNLTGKWCRATTLAAVDADDSSPSKHTLYTSRFH